jgi:hypothetical protein
VSGTLTFAPGVRVRIIPIIVLRDVKAEGSEIFTVHLSHPVNAGLGQTQRQVVIKDNDFGGTVQFDAVTYVKRERPSPSSHSWTSPVATEPSTSTSPFPRAPPPADPEPTRCST